MPFKEIDDKLWMKICPILPVWKPMIGITRANLRKTFNEILHVLYTDCRWEEVPKEYAAKSNAHRLHLKLDKESMYQDIWDILLSVDMTVVQ